MRVGGFSRDRVLFSSHMVFRKNLISLGSKLW
jgi:hypothetical protein